MLFNRPNGWDYLSKWSFRKQTILILNKSKLERFDHREITLLKHLTDLAYHSHRLKFDRPELGRANASSRASKTCPSEWRGGQTTSWTSAQTITSDSRSVYVVDLKCSIPGLSLFFVLSNKHFNFYDKKCRESNTCPSEYESPTITTRPGLPWLNASPTTGKSYEPDMLSRRNWRRGRHHHHHRCLEVCRSEASPRQASRRWHSQGRKCPSWYCNKKLG